MSTHCYIESFAFSGDFLKPSEKTLKIRVPADIGEKTLAAFNESIPDRKKIIIRETAEKSRLQDESINESAPVTMREIIKTVSEQLLDENITETTRNDIESQGQEPQEKGETAQNESNLKGE